MWEQAELRQRWKGLLVLAVLAGLLGGATMALVAGARRTDSAYERFRDESLTSDVVVQASELDPALEDEVDEAMAELRRLPGVAATTEVRLYGAFSDLASDYDIGIFTPLDESFGTTIERHRVLEGRLPAADRPDEVTVNESAALQLGARVGDRVQLQTFGVEQFEELMATGVFSDEFEGAELDLLVTGIVRSPAEVGEDEADVSLFATPAFHEAHATDVASFGGILGVRLEDGASVDDFIGRARPLFPVEGAEVSLTPAADQDQRVEDALGVLAVGLLAVGIAVGVVGALVATQAIGRQLFATGADQRVLAALGMTTRARATALVRLLLPVALVAGVVAAVVSLAASPLFPIDLARRAEPDPGLSVDWLVLGAGSVAVALFVVLAAAAHAWRLSRRAAHPVESAPLSPTRPSSAARVAAAVRLGPSARTGVRLALEPGRGRTAVPVRPAIAGAVVSLAGVVAALVFASSLGRLVDSPERYGAPWDLTPEPAEDEAEAIVSREDVGTAARVATAQSEIEGRQVQAYAVEALRGSPSLTVLDGRAPQDESEVALGPELFERFDVSIGDEVAVTESFADDERTVTVVGSVLVPGFDEDPFSSGALFTVDGFERSRQSEGFSKLALTWRDGVDHEAGIARLQDDHPDAVNVYSVVRPPNEVQNLSRVEGLPQLLAGLLALVGLAAVGHAMASMVRRRRHDLAVLRCLGFTRRQVGATAGWQATTLVVVGALLGIPLGLAAGRWVWAVVANGLGVATDPSVPVLTVLLLTPVAVLVANAAATVPGRLAARVGTSALRAE